MENGGDRLFLLALVRNARIYCLYGSNIRFAQLEVGGWLPLDDDDGKPWKVAAISH